MKNESSIPFWVILLVLATLAVGVGGHEVWTPDEPREAAIARSIFSSRTWLIPELGGQPFVEKPPLYYWVSALMMRSLGAIIGPTTAARATSALCAALTLLVTWLVVRRSWGRFRGWAVLLILGTMFGFVRAGHWIIIDPLLMLLISASVLLLFLGLDRERDTALLAGYCMAGLAFLTKGFVAWMLLFLPWGLLGGLYFRSIRRRPGLHLAGLLLLLGPPAVWMAAFYLQGGTDLWREWFIVNQIGRFTGGSSHLGHIKGPFYYLWMLPLILLPWTPALIGWAVARGWRSRPGQSGEGRNLLFLSLAWGLGGVLLLSLAGTKREVYLYPLLPAFAIMTAAGFATIPRWSGVVIRVLCGIFLLVLLVFSFFILDWEAGSLTTAVGINLPVLLCAGAGIISFLYLKKRPVAQTAAVASLFYIAASLTAMPVLDKVWSYRPMTGVLAAAIPAEFRDRVCVWGNDETTQAVFSYYRDITLPMIKDPIRVTTILKGEDPAFDLIVIPRLGEFEESNPFAPSWKTLARAGKGRRRVFYLITKDEENTKNGLPESINGN